MIENPLPKTNAIIDTSFNIDTNISLKQATENFQRQLILQALELNQGNWAAAARQLGIDRANLSRLAKRLDIQVIKTVRDNR